MEFFGGLVKIEQKLILAHPTLLLFFFYFLFFLTAASLAKLAFGREILVAINWLKTFRSESDKNRNHEDWIAECKPRQGWKQKADAEYLNLEGKYLKKLTFTVAPVGRPENWRAGIMLGNEKIRPQDIVDTENGITVHVGKPGSFEKGIHVWRYDKEHPVNQGEESPALIKDDIGFRFQINKSNHLSVHVGNQTVYEKEISLSFRRKIFLLAWADQFANCKVTFTKIQYTI